MDSIIDITHIKFPRNGELVRYWVVFSTQDGEENIFLKIKCSLKTSKQVIESIANDFKCTSAIKPVYPPHVYSVALSDSEEIIVTPREATEDYNHIGETFEAFETFSDDKYDLVLKSLKEATHIQDEWDLDLTKVKLPKGTKTLCWIVVVVTGYKGKTLVNFIQESSSYTLHAIALCISKHYTLDEVKPKPAPQVRELSKKLYVFTVNKRIQVYIGDRQKDQYMCNNEIYFSKFLKLNTVQ